MELPAASGGESIKVFVRVRPPDPHLESADLDRSACLDVTSQSSLTVHCKPEPKVFTFDHVAAMHTTQEDVFSSVGRPIIDSCMCGYNGTVFAYGQTGSGKTFTMIGPSDDSNNFTHELRGIIPRSFEYLFSLINREKQKYGDLVEFLCKCSFLEIYNEQVYDLIDPASCGLHLRENMKHGVYVDGLLETSVASAREAYEVLSTGWANRRVAATSMNRESSRSHAVFTLTIESKKREGKDTVAKLKRSVLNLVDLAGSERQRDTHTAGVRLKEAGSINKSLSALGNVIMALVDIAHGKSRHVHYRDSKLTFLLRDSLGGNAKTNLVANVHPSARCFGESLSTLNFARRAKMIKNKAVVNEDATGNVLQLQSEIRRLKEQLERYRSGEHPLSSPSVPPPSLGYSARSDDDKTIHELREMLTASMTIRDKAEKDQSMLLDRVENLQKLCKQKDSFLQSTKMILKFRETHIANLEKNKPSEFPSDNDQDAAISLLKQEIEQLKYMVNHHPDVSKFARESLDLKSEVKRLQAMATGGRDLSRELARTHKYTLQLERQLRHFLTKDESSPMKRPSSQSKVVVSEVENVQSRCVHLQSELDKARKTLNTEREDFHLKETKLEASLTATKKANLELERSIEALKLKNSVEKATLNDMHMNTIKSMLTPRKDLIKSVSSTPYGIHRSDSDPLKQLSLSFNGAVTTPTRPPTILESPGKIQRVSSLTNNSRFVGLHRESRVKSEDSDDITNDVFSTPRSTKKVVLTDGEDELNIEGALTDELKILQDKHRHLQQQIEDLEVKVFRLTQDKTTLETQLNELTQLSHSERESMQSRHEECLENITGLTSQIATLTSNNTVLDSEVVDLRVCLKSADKEIAELKSDMKEERHSHEIKLMEYMQRIGELEQLVSTQAAGWDRSTEELQSLQNEMETLREELTFKDHRISELGQAVVREKDQSGSLEKEVQGLLEKLACEVEKNTRLSCELQEGSQGKEELVAMVNENSKLKSELEHLETELRTQLTTHKQELENTEETINSLMKRQASDETAITGFMGTIQELRESCTRSESKAVSLSKEVEDSNKELCAADVRIDELTTQVSSLGSQLSEQAFQFERDLKRKESENEVIMDDLDGLNDQYQQMQEAFDTQSKCLKEAQSENDKLQTELTEKESELARLYVQQRERRESLTKTADNQLAFSVEEKEEEIEELKHKLDEAAGMISIYETGREEKNKELHSLKEELSSTEHLRDENKALSTQISTLQYKLSFTEDHLQQTESELHKRLEEALTRVEKLERESRSATQARDKAVHESAELRDTCQGQRNSIDALTQQIARYKSHEESLFLEKENLRSQLETIQEEQSKLTTECEKLAKENAAITGHQNIRQKIQYHATVKVENSKLKEEVIQLRGRLKRKNEQVTQLHLLLNEKDTQPTSKLTKNDPKVSQKTLNDSEL